MWISCVSIFIHVSSNNFWLPLLLISRDWLLFLLVIKIANSRKTFRFFVMNNAATSIRIGSRMKIRFYIMMVRNNVLLCFNIFGSTKLCFFLPKQRIIFFLNIRCHINALSIFRTAVLRWALSLTLLGCASCSFKPIFINCFWGELV